MVPLPQYGPLEPVGEDLAVLVLDEPAGRDFEHRIQLFESQRLGCKVGSSWSKRKTISQTTNRLTLWHETPDHDKSHDIKPSLVTLVHH
jgi:hypothetical protein